MTAVRLPRLSRPGVLESISPKQWFALLQSLCRFFCKPVCADHACERADIMNIGGFSDAVFNLISEFLADDNPRFVADVEAIEL